MQAHWSATLKRSPTFATSLGVRDYDDQLNDLSMEAYEDSIAEARNFLSELDQLNPETLNEAHQLNYQLLKLQLENQIEASQFGGKYLIMNNRSGPAS